MCLLRAHGMDSIIRGTVKGQGIASSISYSSLITHCHKKLAHNSPVQGINCNFLTPAQFDRKETCNMISIVSIRNCTQATSNRDLKS